MEPMLVGIAGGSGSGKTTLSRSIVNALGAENVTYICHDFYYRDLSHLAVEERAKTNFDHPDSLETSLMIEQLAELRRGGTVELPSYDFSVHTRAPKTTRTRAKKIIVVEGILIFCDPGLRELLDVKIFVDTEADIRFIRRMQRDIKERQRSVGDVVKQYMETVRPMHELFVSPSKMFCDIIVQDSLNGVVLDMVVARLRAHVAKQGHC